jgi:apolipoprotein D and lipocalin family protein
VRQLALAAAAALLAVAAPLVRPASGGDTAAPPGAARAEPVARVDLERYAGRWYEIARYPNRFQAKCACCVSATYTLREDGRMSVVNECRTRDGASSRAEGVARRAEAGGPTSRLKVRFAPGFLSFLSAVWGDYWILDLPDDYSHALVGSPDHQYLWILAREPSLPEDTYARILAAAARQGFDPARLARTPPQPAEAAAGPR